MIMTYKDLKIVYEDNHVLVVVKPYDVPVQADESGDPDMVNMLKQYLVETYNKPGDAYLGLVHRLDRPTGGVMVFAKTSKAASRLCQAIRDGEVEKRYLAIVDGKVVPALSEGAKYAELVYKVLCSKHDVILVLVNLVTGRGHQIRVQLSNMGNPIVGDKKYGNNDKSKCPLCLWACELKFEHPVSGKEMTFRVYPPEVAPWTIFDMNAYLNISIKNCY